MSAAVGIGTFLLLLFCALDVVGVATDYWMTVGHALRLAKSHAGLFKICYQEIMMEDICSYFDPFREEFQRGKNCDFCKCVYDCFIGYEKV